MELSPSAHQDTFARDHLPDRELWPQLDFALPELRYPERLNCAVELLDATLARHGGERPALRTTGPDGVETRVWSYERLRSETDRLAHVLTEDLGVRPGNRVLLRGPTSPRLAECWLAVLKAGAVAVTVLAAHRRRELRTICELARVRHALCAAESVEELAAAQVPDLRTLTWDSGCEAVDESPGELERLAAARPDRYEAVRTAADDVALIAFTSGTTGRPKGCMHFHRDVLAIADTFSAHVLRPTEGDVFAGSPPLGFTFGLGGLVVFPLRAGACAVLEQWSGPDRMLEAIARHRVSVLFTAPTAYRALLAGLDSGDVSSLRRCVSAGENLPAATWEDWHARTGLRLINGIGATEMLHIFVAAADEDARPGRTGLPVPGFTAQVQDAAGRPLPDGEPGLLAVRGPLGCRYLADERQRDYVRNGWNLTGDTYVREPDGWFRYVARADDMIISSGHNIAGPEVEEALLRHPDVLEVAVVGEPDEKRGQRVVAHVVLREGVEPGEATARGLTEFARAELAPYKCPRQLEFTEALPRTPTGKLQRFRLRRTPAPGTALE
ncbi:AMP-binding protein [Streptomyces sp. XM4193]|uniref:AMP-binding protein n=1 Tax=Streptomyces sp. XM4193 TaxID=2929782 RepID=UPI001FF6FD29|nr:AMP-binding protein [Streptomyces sp. XM4193]MCK1797035.1 AMP-binding protein [Streptomyces sp. XM4193]